MHGTGGMASLTALYWLGPRIGSLERKNRTLRPVDDADRPILVLFGALILWYGWFAFNVTSPFLAPLEKFDHTYISTAGLNTLIAPSFATISGLMWLFWKDKDSIKFEEVVAVVLAGAVSVTGCCYTVNWWAAACIGFLASPVYFISFWFVREKLHIDDPLGVVAMHLCCGYYSILAEGLFANGKVGDAGLFYGGFEHFGVQCLGLVSLFAFQFISNLILWHLVLRQCFIKQCGYNKDNDVKVSYFDTFIGVQTRIGMIDRDFQEILKCESTPSKNKLYRLHLFCLSYQAGDDENGDEQKEEVDEHNHSINGGGINGGGNIGNGGMIIGTGPEEDEEQRGLLSSSFDREASSNRNRKSSKSTSYYSNCLDFLLAIKYLEKDWDSQDHDEDKIKQDLGEIFRLYIRDHDRTAKKSTKISRDLMYQAMRLKDNGDEHCFDQIYRTLYVKLTTDIIPTFLQDYEDNNYGDNPIRDIPYRRNRWDIVWKHFALDHFRRKPSLIESVVTNANTDMNEYVAMDAC